MDYETSPTMKYDGSEDAPHEGDNQSEKTSSTASEGSEGFVKGMLFLKSGLDNGQVNLLRDPWSSYKKLGYLILNLSTIVK